MLGSLSSKIADLDEDACLDLTRHLIALKTDPLKILEHSHKGMVEIGKRYEKGQYFISGLIMAGEIMQGINQMVLPLTLESRPGENIGRVVIGTVEGDIHFIGKDIFKALIRGHGFAVHDLGVNVPQNRFLSAIYEFKPDIVGFSCLISSSLDTLKATIAYLKAVVPEDLAPEAYLAGGRSMTPRTGRMVGADLYTDDSMEGVRLCQKALKW
ncbi:MAG: hypothetical protein A2277_14235 [Desulfobacterales bacterium RIFOXYA12_FULL_46_15]|nr:MAG: hypothetical protein A2277_14235 [Desulfobacterales bacterium RIFOXYA12_FULL_46_15]